ncbi:MAG: response regulator, partial [Myxococcota bacterium]
MAKATIGELLVSAGLLQASDLPQIEANARETESRFASSAVQLGLISEQEVLQFLARQHGVPAVDLTRSVLPRGLLGKIPQEVAEREEVLPLRLEESNLLVAMSSPDNVAVRDEIAFVTGFSVLPYVALRSRLLSTINEAYKDNADPYLGPGADPSQADPAGYVAIVTEAPLPMAEEVSMEVEIEMEVEGDEVLGPDDLVEVADDEIVEEPTPDGYAHWVGEEAKTVVVIDDEPEILRLLVTTLSTLNINIVSALRGVDALLKIKQHKPDLVVTDAMLPEVHGFEIVKKLKESKRFASTPVLMISAIYRGWRIAEDIKETYQVDAFLEKPFRVAELRHQVERLLESSRKGDVTELPAEALSRYSEGVEAYKSGQLELSFDKLKEAESLEPFSSRVQFMIARVLERQERPLQSIYHYERAIELNPKMFAATKNLALLYQAKGFKNKAIEMWERSLRAAPSDEVREQIKAHLVSIL